MSFAKELGNLKFLEYAVLIIPIIFRRKRGGRRILIAKGKRSPLEEERGLEPGDVALAPKLMRKWGNLAREATQIHRKVPPWMVLAIIHAESRGDIHIVSPSGAEGLMQLTPGVQQSFGVSDPFDPWDNIEGGAHYFSFLLERYLGDLQGAVIAYHWGMQNYDNAAKRSPEKIPAAMIAFSKRVLALSQLYKELGA